MATVTQVYEALDAFAPFRTQMDFDNAGFLVGRGEREVTGVLVALDITLPVVEEAKALGANLIVSHHPVIFHPARSLVSGDPNGEILLALAEEKLAAICAHTNLDVAVGGVNDALAEAVGLRDIRVFLPETGLDAEGRPYGLGRIGTLPEPLSVREFAQTVKDALRANSVRFVESHRPVRTVAVGGGACGEYLQAARDKGCDLFLTADVKYNTFLDAKAMSMGLIDAGHFPTENVVLPKLAEAVQAAFPGLAVSRARSHREVYSAL